MAKYTIKRDQVEKKSLPGRSVKVLTNELEVENMTVGVCEVPANSSMKPHSHIQEELIYILHGHGYVEIEGTRESVGPGTLIHFPSNMEHFTVNESNKTMQFIFCFSPQVEVGSYDKS